MGGGRGMMGWGRNVHVFFGDGSVGQTVLVLSRFLRLSCGQDRMMEWS